MELEFKMSSYQLPPIEKLHGRENYDTWKFAVQTYLEHEELWESVRGTDQDTKKDTKARSKIILLVDPLNYVHVQTAKTAKEAWDNLASAFQDTGLTRRVGLLRTLITTSLENSDSVEDYVNKIIITAHKLSNIGLKVSDEWVGTILLAGLPDSYKPMIMGIESSGTPVTADSIKTKLLQDISVLKGENGQKNVAMYGSSSSGHSGFTNKQKGNNSSKPKGVRCYQCNKYGHFANKCDQKKDKVGDKKNNNSSGNAALFSAFSCQTKNNISWFLDSGCSAHMTADFEVLQNIKKSSSLTITTANSQQMNTDSTGEVNLSLSVDKKLSSVKVSDIYYVPEINVNLLSVSQIVTKGNTVVFNSEGAKIFNSEKELIATASHENKLFRLDTSTSVNGSAMFNASNENKCNLWHRRLAHVNSASLNKLKNGLVEGIHFSDNLNQEIACEVCILGKTHRLPFRDSDSSTTRLLELVHSDLCGPMQENSLSGSRYILTFLDDFSHKSFVYFLKSKDQVFENFKNFKIFVETQTGQKIKSFRTDNGGEYCNNNLLNYFKSTGIQHQTSVPYSPQQNGKAERLNRTIIEKARCLLIESGLPNKFWAEAVYTSVYVLNRLPTRCIERTPEEIWTGKKPTVKYMKIFGCKAFSHVPVEKRKKLDPKAIPCIFVGYSLDSKAYRIYNVEKKEIFISRDVQFIESEKGALLLATNTQKNQQDFFYFPETVETVVENIEPHENPIIEEPEHYAEENQQGSDSSSSSDDYADFSEEEAEQYLDDPIFVPDQIIPELQEPGQRIQRTRKPPEAMKDYVTYSTVIEQELDGDPTTVQQVLSRSDKDSWLSAMKNEYDALIENGTWELVDLPPGKKSLDSKWVFKTKRNEHGQVSQYKARLVIKGCAQRKGIDFEETYSPVVRYSGPCSLVVCVSALHAWGRGFESRLGAWMFVNVQFLICSVCVCV